MGKVNKHHPEAVNHIWQVWPENDARYREVSAQRIQMDVDDIKESIKMDDYEQGKDTEQYL